GMRLDTQRGGYKLRSRPHLGSEFVRAVTMAPPPVLLFDLLKFLPLFVGKIDCDLLVRFRPDLMDLPAGVAAYLLQLGGGFMANSFVKSLYCSRLCLISRTAANVEIATTAADSSATRRSSEAIPFGFAAKARQSATTRVSNPNGISAGASSPACAADCNNRSISWSFILLLLPKSWQDILSFFASPETP